MWKSSCRRRAGKLTGTTAIRTSRTFGFTFCGKALRVRSHCPRLQIDFHIAAHGRFTCELPHRVAKIRPGTVIPEARMQHAQRAAVREFQFVPQQALVMPDVLQQRLGRKVVLTQDAEGTERGAP